jgi:hypothetical protein
MRVLFFLIAISIACTSGTVEERRRELCRQLCASMNCTVGAEPPLPDDSCVQSCFNTSKPGAASCLGYLEAWVNCSRQHHPGCSAGPDPCVRERCASGACDSCQGCRVTCPEPNMCVTETGSRTLCD